MLIFLGQDFEKIFRPIEIGLKNLLLALLDLALGWSLYFSSIIKMGTCSYESGHLYPLLAIFKIGIFIKYSLKFLAICLSREIILSSSTKLILECFVTFSDRSGSAVLQNVLLSVTTLVSRSLH